jgi:hypothetical protein
LHALSGVVAEAATVEARLKWLSFAIAIGGSTSHRDTRMVERHYGHLAHSYVSEMIRKAAPSYEAAVKSNVVPLTA